MPAARLFFSEGGIEEAIEWVKSSKELSVEEKKNFFETLKDIINHIVDTVKEYVTNKNLTNSEKAVANMSLDDIKKLRKQFLSVLDGAIRNLEQGVEVEVETLKYSVDVNNKKKTKNATELTERDLRNLLERAYINREFDNGTYIPLRATTPQFFIDVVNEYTKSEDYDGEPVEIKNLPMAAEVEHIIQNMEEDDGSSYGKRRPHGFSEDEMIAILKAMGDPQYIVLQKNGRFAEVVSINVNNNRKVAAVIDYAFEKDNIRHNHKDAEYMNGYNTGFYNIVVTQYEPDNLQSYLNDCIDIIYNKKTMNGTYQVGSGRVVTVAHDNPFINNSIRKNDENVKTAKSLDVYSSEYDKAVAAGDEEAAQKYVDEAAMQWGAYSVDGKTPLKLYHGTPNGEFYKFDKNKIGSNTDSGLYGSGFYFSTKQNQSKQYSTGDKGRVINAYLNIHNPLMLNDYSKSELADLLDMDESQFSFDYEDRIARPSYAWINRFTSAVEEKGFDRVVVKYSNGADEYVVFNPEQIKSADPITYDDNGEVIPLEERFTDSKDIRYSKDVVHSDYSEYDKPINQDDILTLRSIGRKSISDFTSEDIKKSQKWAYKFYQQMGTKSPFFRAWFGDWRAYDNNPANDPTIVKFGYGERLPINKDKRNIENADTKFNIRIEPDTINDSLHYATINGDK